MNHRTNARHAGAALALLATTFAGSVALVEGSSASPEAASVEAAAAGKPTTTITFKAPGCGGCEVQLHQGLDAGEPGDPVLWSSRTKEVEDGRVTFRIQSRHTPGMSVTVDAPWEGHTGYETTVAWRYGGKALGEEVTFAQARGKKRASACWEGTRREKLTVPLTVRQVRVRGVHRRVKGSIAFARETQGWLSPMRRAPHGVLGSQDIDICS